MNEDIQRGSRAIERILSKAAARDKLYGYAGLPSGGAVQTYTNYAPGYVYCRLLDGIEGSVGVAINQGTNLDPNLLVELERENGVLVMRRPVATHAAQIGGNNAGGAALPPQVITVVGHTIEDGGALTLIGTNNETLGGLVVRITAYRHRGGYHDGTATITLVPTATSAQRAWVLVGLNTKTNALTQSLTQNRGVGYVTPPRTDIDAIIAANPDVDYRAAVNLANGETSIDQTDIIDLRSMGEARAKSNYSASAAPGVGDDIDDGYGIGSIWIDTTADNVYQCTDASAGAANWEHLNGSGSSLTVEEADGTPSVSGVTKIVVSNGTLTDNGGGEVAVTTGGGSGGITHTYVGYDTAGASNTVMVGGTAYMKKITLAAAGWLGAIGVYIDHDTATNVQGLACWVMSDSAGTPDLVTAIGTRVATQEFFIKASAPRWVDMAMGVYLAAGDYWLCVQRPSDPGTDLRIYYDGSGSDNTQAIGNNWSADGSQYTISSTSNKYSIRGSILT